MLLSLILLVGACKPPPDERNQMPEASPARGLRSWNGSAAARATPSRACAGRRVGSVPSCTASQNAISSPATCRTVRPAGRLRPQRAGVSARNDDARHADQPKGRLAMWPRISTRFESADLAARLAAAGARSGRPLRRLDHHACMGAARRWPLRVALVVSRLLGIACLGRPQLKARARRHQAIWSARHRAAGRGAHRAAGLGADADRAPFRTDPRRRDAHSRHRQHVVVGRGLSRCSRARFCAMPTSCTSRSADQWCWNWTSDDVIHNFWVPRLSGKLDMIPGRTNRDAHPGRRARAITAASAPSTAAARTP